MHHRQIALRWVLIVAVIVQATVFMPPAAATVTVHHTADYNSLTTAQKAISDEFTLPTGNPTGSNCAPVPHTYSPDSLTSGIQAVAGRHYFFVAGATFGGAVDTKIGLKGSSSGWIFNITIPLAQTVPTLSNIRSGSGAVITTWIGSDAGIHAETAAVYYLAPANETYTLICDNTNAQLNTVYSPLIGPSQPNVLEEFAIGAGTCVAAAQCAGVVLNATGVAGAPGTPTVTPHAVADLSGGCVNATWNASTNDPTGYSVFYATATHSAVVPMNSSAYTYGGHVDTNSTNICGLLSGTTYFLRIVGTNEAGEGTASNEGNGTSPAGPPGAISIVRVNSSTVNLSWLAGTRANGYGVWMFNGTSTPASIPLNSTAYAYVRHVDVNYTLITNDSFQYSYCFAVESTNASLGGPGDARTTCASSDTPSPPVLSGTYVPCSTFALSWTLPNGTVDLYRVDQSSSLPFVNRSFYVPPDGNFTLRLLNVSFPQLSGADVDYVIFAHNSAGYSASSNVVNFTPPAVTTIGDCGLQWGGTSSSDFAAQAGISVSAAQVTVSIFLIVIGAGIGYAAMGNGGGVVGGVGAGMLLSVAMGLIPAWAIMFVLVVGAGLGVTGALIGVGQRRLQGGGLGR